MHFRKFFVNLKHLPRSYKCSFKPSILIFRCLPKLKVKIFTIRFAKFQTGCAFFSLVPSLVQQTSFTPKYNQSRSSSSRIFSYTLVLSHILWTGVSDDQCSIISDVESVSGLKRLVVFQPHDAWGWDTNSGTVQLYCLTENQGHFLSVYCNTRRHCKITLPLT